MILGAGIYVYLQNVLCISDKFFLFLSLCGTGREDYIIYMLLYIMVWTMCSLKNLQVKVLV